MQAAQAQLTTPHRDLPHAPQPRVPQPRVCHALAGATTEHNHHNNHHTTPQVARTETSPMSPNPEFLNRVFVMRLPEPIGQSGAPSFQLQCNLFAAPSIGYPSGGLLFWRSCFGACVVVVVVVVVSCSATCLLHRASGIRRVGVCCGLVVVVLCYAVLCYATR
jgi:hypothetical protein